MGWGCGGLKIDNDPLTTVEPKTFFLSFTFFTIIYEFWKEGLVKDLNTGTLYAKFQPTGQQIIRNEVPWDLIIIVFGDFSWSRVEVQSHLPLFSSNLYPKICLNNNRKLWEKYPSGKYQHRHLSKEKKKKATEYF